MNITTIKNHYFKGKDSGYPICCIIAFIARVFLGNLTGRYSKISRKFQHVPCYLHRLLPVKQYTKCKECDWIQYDNTVCTQCDKCDCHSTYE
jgi:hypothetical protein